MTAIEKKREEIQEGLTGVLFSAVNGGSSFEKVAEKVTGYLHSQGVVIVVDDHLSECDAMEIGVAVKPLVKES